jgi:hypothetical protein
MTTNREGPGAASAVRHEVEGPRITDALYQAFTNEPTPMGMDPTDGLPKPIVSQAWKDAQAPDLDPSRFVCMADTSRFVRRNDWGEAVVEFTPAEVQRAPNGRYRVARDVARERYKQGGNAVIFTTDWVEVEPLRPQCQHYARQLVPFPEELDRSLAVRLCTARRTDEGEFLDLGNQQILACELRSPVFGNEQALIDAFDERTLATQQERKNNEVTDDFDVDVALGAQTTTKGT